MDVLISRLGQVGDSARTHPSYLLRSSETAGVDGRPIVLYRILLTEKTGRFEKTPG
jgi:hypothetical protein